MAFDVEKFLNTPLYAFDQQLLFSDVLSFLHFAEQSIERQKLDELESLYQELATTSLEEPDVWSWEQHRKQTIAFRFDFALPMRVRYAALSSFIATVEWSITLLAKRMKVDNLKEPRGANRAIFLTNEISRRCQLSYSTDVVALEFLTWVRNCITHNAGLIKGYKHEQQLRASMKNFTPAFQISNWHWIGDTIEIQHGALDPFIEKWSNNVYDLEKAAHEHKLIT